MRDEVIEQEGPVHTSFSWRALVVLLVLSTFLVFLYQRTEIRSPEHAASYNTLLQQLLQENAQVDSEVLASRMLLSQNYDALIFHLKRLRSVSESLLEVPAFAFDDDVQRMRVAAENLNLLVIEKQSVVDGFQRQNAIFKSSLAFFEKTLRDFWAENDGQQQLKELEGYSRSIMFFLADPSQENIRYLQLDYLKLKQVDLTAQDLSEADLELINSLLSHGRILEKYVSEIDGLVRELLTLPVREQQEALAESFFQSMRNIEISTSVYRNLLYGVAIILTLYVTFIFIHLESARKHLLRSHKELKRRYVLQKHAEKLLRLHEIAFNSAHEAIALTDNKQNIMVVNPAFERITGFTTEEVLGKTPNILKSGRHSPDFYHEMWQSIEETGNWRGEIWNRNKYGDIYPEMLSITAVTDNHDHISNYVAVFSDISHIKKHEKELRQMAYYDALTGLPNRAMLRDRMSWAMAHTKRSRTNMAVCYLDLDGFKPVNDTFGHEAGDQLLVELSQRFKNTLRAEDTVARIGGDEFVFLFLNLKHPDEYQLAVNRLLHTATQTITVANQPVNVSASIGVTLYPVDSSDSDALLRHADQAMYEAKQKGRNGYALFDAKRDSLTRNLHEKQSQIEAALKNREFQLYYQPKVDIRRGKVVGMEALIRWNHPRRGLVPPIEFLPPLEGSELMIRLGKWVLNEALAQMAQWQSQGVEVPVSINVSAEQLQDSQFIAILQSALASHDSIKPELLQLEILETTALEDIVSVSQLIEKCQALGVSVALDDFGTGYSSLTYLKRLPATVLKIDRSFVQDIISDPESLALVRGVMGLARAFGKTAVAEGVESIEHGVLLMQLGCDLVQGYGISRPMPAADVLQWMAQWQVAEEWQFMQSLYWEDADYPLIAAKVEHRRWIDMMMYAIAHKKPLAPDNFKNHKDCAFGRWYYSADSQERYQGVAAFEKVEVGHEKVHQIAEEITRLYGEYLSGKDYFHEPVQARITEMLAARDDVLTSLGEIQLSVASLRRDSS